MNVVAGPPIESLYYLLSLAQADQLSVLPRGGFAPLPHAKRAAYRGLRDAAEEPVTYLLIHGGGSTARFWDRLLPYLDRPAFAVDLPGRNGKPADFGTLTVDDEVASVLADVERRGAADASRSLSSRIRRVGSSCPASLPASAIASRTSC